MTTTTAPRVVETPRAIARLRPSPRWLLHIVLVVIAVIWLAPSVGLLITSFRPPAAIADSGWWTAFSPARFTLANYEHVLFSQGMGQAFRNSFLITIPSTILPLIVASLAAYAFAWLDFPGRDWVFLGVLVLLIIPLQTTLVPVLQMFNGLGLNGTLHGL